MPFVLAENIKAKKEYDIMAQKRILIPTKSIDNWQALLSEPDKHWRTGYSAMMMAQSWEKADGLPPEITSAFTQSGDDNFNNLELILAIPEYQTHLKGGPRPSQSDVFALLRSENCLIAVTIEGKARENFGPTLDQWQNGVSEKGAGKRLSHIRNYIGLEKPIPGHIRYQLLHRTASAVIEARRFHCKAAAMLVQSFVESNIENHFDDYKRFIDLYGVVAMRDRLMFLTDISGISLYTAWIYSAPPIYKQ